MKTATIPLWVISLLCLTGTQLLHAQTDRLALAPKAGTLGLGADLIVQVNPEVNTRLGINAFSTKFDLEFSDIDYQADFDLLSYSALVDWYMFQNAFRVSGGILYNESEADFKADAAATYQIGSTSYTAAQVGSLRANLDYDQEIAPYLGVGWGNPFDTEKRYGLMCDFGVVYTDTPTVTLSDTGGGVSAADLAGEQDKIQDDLDKIKFYPVISVSLWIRF